MLTTFSPALANALAIKLERLVGNVPEVRSRIQVKAIREVARELYVNIFSHAPALVDEKALRSHLTITAAAIPDRKFPDAFVWSEWNDLVDTWQVTTWEAYRDVPRLGRKTRLGSKQREQLWQVFEKVQQWLKAEDALTWAGVFEKVTDHLTNSGEFPYTFAVVDEAQDMGIAELKFFAAIGSQRRDSLFFTGDSGQRIFQQPFSWKALGVDIRGRSQTLKINYPTSHQIRASADRLLPSSISDVDGNEEDRRHTISGFNGPVPVVEVYDSPDDEIEAVGEWIANRLTDGFQPEEIGVFVRDHGQLERAIAAIEHAGTTPVELNEYVAFKPECVAYSSMRLAKRLEFRAVVVMVCDDEVIPQQERIESVTDESALEEVYTTEHHLLYVACTKARDHLLLSGVDPASEFLDDIH